METKIITDLEKKIKMLRERGVDATKYEKDLCLMYAKYIEEKLKK